MFTIRIEEPIDSGVREVGIYSSLKRAKRGLRKRSEKYNGGGRIINTKISEDGCLISFDTYDLGHVSMEVVLIPQPNT